MKVDKLIFGIKDQSAENTAHALEELAKAIRAEDLERIPHWLTFGPRKLIGLEVMVSF